MVTSGHYKAPGSAQSVAEPGQKKNPQKGGALDSSFKRKSTHSLPQPCLWSQDQGQEKSGYK